MPPLGHFSLIRFGKSDAGRSDESRPQADVCAQGRRY